MTTPSCSFCHRPESQKTKTDYLRTAYYHNGKFDKKLFSPYALKPDEIALLKEGLNYLCSARTACRERVGINRKRLKNKVK